MTELIENSVAWITITDFNLIGRGDILHGWVDP